MADGIHAIGDPLPVTKEELLELIHKKKITELLDSIPEVDIADYLILKGWNVS